jgi:arsenite-transporting ATPase
MSEARNVFRNPETTEFVIVAIPNAMAAAESIRLAKALRKEAVSASGGWRWVWGLL